MPNRINGKGRTASSSPDTIHARHLPHSTYEERLRFLEDFVLNNPYAALDTARKALIFRFGKALNQQVMADTFKTVRELLPKRDPLGAMLSGMQQQKAQDQAKEDILYLVTTMKQRAIRSITVNDDGSFHIVPKVLDGGATPVLEKKEDA